jgi:hypothetical protein
MTMQTVDLEHFSFTPPHKVTHIPTGTTISGRSGKGDVIVNYGADLSGYEKKDIVAKGREALDRCLKTTRDW